MSRRPRILRCPAARGLAAWLFATLAVAPPGLPRAAAAPQGENVVQGEASFARDGDLTVIRPSDGAIIEYTGFDILRQETVRFEQPSERSRVLNRVSGDTTRIDGTLQANGIVYLVNPAGVFFGGNAVVDVGRLVAAAGSITDADFRSGVDAFALTGALENFGRVEASAVTLLGRSVANHGSIVAPGGVIALVAGDRVILTQLDGGIAIEVEGPAQGAAQGIQQTGLVDAAGGTVRFAVGDHYSLALNHEGITRGRDVELDGGDDGLVRVTGTLDASNPDPGATGGFVRVTGDRVVLEGAWLDASGAAGGGEILVGGDRRGEGPFANARRTFVDTDSTLRADALESGDGGSVVVFGDEAAGFLGRISARGGEAGGDGGFAELSSGGLLIDEGRVDVGAPVGEVGTLLYDPRDIVIRGGMVADGSDDPDLSPDVLNDAALGRVIFGDASDPDPFLVWESELEGTNANIELQARNSITADGTFDHDANGAEAGYEGDGVVVLRPSSDLILRTRNNSSDGDGSTTAAGIDLTTSAHTNDLEFRTSGDGEMRMQTGSDGAGGGGSVEANIRVGRLVTAGGAAGFVALDTRDGSITANHITTTGAGSTGTDAGRNGGRIEIITGDADGSGNNSVLVTGNLTSRGGDSAGGLGGNGARVQIQSQSKPGTNDPPEGGGPITVMGAIDTSGGDGKERGGDAGFVQLASVRGDVTSTSITARGGDGNDPDAVSHGGTGGEIQLVSENGVLRTGTIDAGGGTTDGNQTEDVEVDGVTVPRALEFGGQAGGLENRSVQLRAAGTEDGQGRVIFTGSVSALGGDNLHVFPENTPDNGDGFGADVTVFARESIEAVVAGPHISTQANVHLESEDIGTPVAPIELSGGGTPEGQLVMLVSGTARVLAGANGFDDLRIAALAPTADIELAQGADIVDLEPGGANTSEITRLDTTESGAHVQVELRDSVKDDPLTTGVDEDLQLTLRVGEGATPGGNLALLSEDDIVLGDAGGVVITMQAQPQVDPEPGDPTVAGVLILSADADTDGKGAVLDLPGAGSGRVDLVGNADESGGMNATAGAGVGTLAEPIVIDGGGGFTATTRESGGIFVRNVGSGDLIVLDRASGVRVLEGNGDIVLDNTAGDLVIEDPVVTSGDEDELGGDVTLRAVAGSAIVLATPTSSELAVDANADAIFAGTVHLMEDSRVVSQNGNLDFQSTIDTDPARGDRVRSLTATTVAEDATIRLAGDIGQTSDLRDLTFAGDVVLDGGGTRRIDTTNNLTFLGDIRGTGDDDESLAILAGPRVRFGGNIGADPGTRLGSFSIERNATPPFPQTLADPTVTFDGLGDQALRTGAGGIAFSPGGRTTIPDRASIAKVGGGLTLASEGGEVNLGPNEKLTAQGNVVLSGSTVYLGDVSALELLVQSDNPRVRARAPGPVRLRGGNVVTDGGTDLFGNVVEFEGANAPEIEDPGAGPAPRIAARTATNTGTLVVQTLPGSLSAGDLVSGSTVLDLAILPADPGHETPQQPPWMEGLVDPRPGDDEPAGSALPPGAEETLSFLRCSSEDRDECDVVPESPLDSPRGEELAQAAAALLGDSPEARELREGLERLDPAALRRLAVFLTEVRLLGLSDDEYQAVRDALFDEILADRGPDAPDPLAFAAAVQGQARGVPL